MTQLLLVLNELVRPDLDSVQISARARQWA